MENIHERWTSRTAISRSKGKLGLTCLTYIALDFFKNTILLSIMEASMCLPKSTP